LLRYWLLLRYNNYDNVYGAVIMT